MKKYLMPFLFSMALPGNLAGQTKVEANSRNLDLKNKFLDISVTNPEGLQDYANDKGEIKAKFGYNALYLVRNGLLNHGYGGNLNFRFVGGYYNATDQSDKKESEKTQSSPIGDITTKTTLLEKNTSQDYGVILNHKGFFVSYENAVKNSGVDGSTLITINGADDLVSFSTLSKNISTVYSAGFERGFAKFIQNEYLNKEDGAENEKESFSNILLHGNYSSVFNKTGVVIGVYQAVDLETSRINDKNAAGFLGISLFRDINAYFFYDGQKRKGKLNLATPDYGVVNIQDFQRNLENRLRLAPRIYDSEMETYRKYLEDMFFAKPQNSIKLLGKNIPFGYNFSLEKDKATASVNLDYVLLHYSPESQAIGLKYKFALGTYDFKKKEAKAGVFFR